VLSFHNLREDKNKAEKNYLWIYFVVDVVIIVVVVAYLSIRVRFACFDNLSSARCIKLETMLSALISRLTFSNLNTERERERERERQNFDQ
jgi:hypothetical protein